MSLEQDAAALVQVPSVTGDERAAMERLAEIAAGLGLEAELREHDLGALRANPAHPGEEAPRDELVGLTVTRRGPPGAPRLCLNGHLDVVAPGTEEWRLGPWSGAVEDGFLHGRGSVDMKGAVVAALHALAEVEEPGCEVVLLAVGSEEDGGLGTFAALEADARFDACLVPEPTGFDVVCAQAGALTFSGEVRGRGAHAALRLEGASAIDAYVEVHAALAEHERRLNADVAHPLLRGARAAVPGVGGPADGGRVVQLRAGPRAVRGPAGGEGGRVAGGCRGRPAGRSGRSAGRAALRRRPLRAGRDAGRPPVHAARARAPSPARARSACPTVPTCACSASAASPA